MNGDLSLAGSLGGLRIANPDDEATSSPTPPTTTISTPEAPHSDPRPIPLAPLSTSTAERSIRPESKSPMDHLRNPSIQNESPPYSGSATQQRSMPMGYQAQQQMYHTSDSRHGSAVRNSVSNPASSRPISGIYNHPNTSSSSQLSTKSSSRYRGDPTQRQAPIGVSRSVSRGGNGVPSGYPSRQPSRSERGYGQSPQYNGGNGSSVARQNSTRVQGHKVSSSRGQMSPYGLEGGPLPSSEDWKDRGAAVSTRQEIDAEGRSVSKLVKKGVKDFSFGRTLGEGSYSTVLAATDRQSSREYAIKVLDKKHIIKEKKVKYVNIEKDTLNRLTEHPGIVRLYYTFQDERSLYFVLDLASGGELLGVLKKIGTFDEQCTRFYAGQILDSIAYMHSRGIIHRDLKPENVLLDDQMHTKITDFGTAKILGLEPQKRGAGGTGADATGDPLDGAETDRAVSFVGTAEYVSPELLTDKNACKASDLWAFGCILYQLLAGRPPFKAANEYLTFQKIVALDYVFPEGFPKLARDLIERLLVLDPVKRLPIDGIQRHPFFDGLRWGRDLWTQKAPRLKPYVPASAEPIRLNGNSPPYAVITSTPAANNAAVHNAGQQATLRPQLRNITELPPPSQLDIDWSPVLTRNNERILKLGNLIVTSNPAPHSPTAKGGESTETPRKLSRFFGGNTTKKKQRLVMITSSARIIVVAAGGDEKKAKLELLLLGSEYKSYQDGRGLTAFSIDTRDKHIIFEDPRATTSDPDGSKYSTKEWMDCIEWAKGIALSHSAANSYSGSSPFSEIGSSITNTGNPSDLDLPLDQGVSTHHGRQTLRKEQSDSDSIKGKRSRFSKRQSKSGLAAVF